MLENGFIKLHRSLTKWEWYDDVYTFKIFFHLLLTVNYEDQKWHGLVIERGQRVVSYSILSAETHLSVRQLRTSFMKLKETGELTSKNYNKFTIVTINNYDSYLDSDKQSVTQATSKRQASDKQATTMEERTNKANKANNIYDDFFDTVWPLLKSHTNDVKKRVSAKRRKELMAIGYDKIKVACERYLRDNDPRYYHKRDNFFNNLVENYLDENYVEPAKNKASSGDEFNQPGYYDDAGW